MAIRLLLRTVRINPAFTAGLLEGASLLLALGKRLEALRWQQAALKTLHSDNPTTHPTSIPASTASYTMAEMLIASGARRAALAQ